MIIHKLFSATLGTIMLFKDIQYTDLWLSFIEQYVTNAYNKLHVVYNDAFRLLLRERRRCNASKRFVSQNMTSDAFIRKLVYSLWQSLIRCDKVTVRSFIRCDMIHCLRTIKRWHTVIFNHYFLFLYIVFLSWDMSLLLK